MQNGHPVSQDDTAPQDSLTVAPTNGHHHLETNELNNDAPQEDVATPSFDLATAPTFTASPGPRGQKRKLNDTTSSGKSSRAPSPPWKKVEADGPTTIIENGRRKSGRVSAAVVEPPPQVGKRHAKGAQKKPANDKRRAWNAGSAKSEPRTPTARRGGAHVSSPAGRGRQAARGGSASADRGTQVARGGLASADRGQQPSRRGRARTITSRLAQQETPPTRRSTRTSLGNKDSATSDVRTPVYGQTIRLAKGYVAFIPGPLPILHPGNVVRPPKYTSLREYLTQDDPFDDGEGDRRLTDVEAQQEASKIQRVLDARDPGRPFADESRLVIEAQRQEEPLPHPAHPHIDHVVNHALELRRLMQIERNSHMRQAKMLAHAVAAKVRQSLPETAEERREKQAKESKQRHRALLRELMGTFGAVRASVRDEMFRKHQQMEEAQAKKELDDKLANAHKLINARTGPRFSLPGQGTRGSSLLTDRPGSAALESADFSGTELENGYVSADGGPNSGSQASNEDDEVEDDDDDDDDDSDDEDEDDEGEGQDRNSDDELDEEQLKAKYVSLDSATSEPENQRQDKTEFDPGGSDAEQDVSMLEADESLNDMTAPDLEEVDVALLDDSDAGSTSGTEQTSSGSDATDSETGEADDNDDADDVGNSLWGFFSKNEIQKLENEAPSLPQEEAVAEADDGQSDEHVENPADQDQPDADKAIETKESDTVEDACDSDKPESDWQGLDSVGDGTHVPIPSLLRGTLRPYQREGLDWLARMYANDTNGILADEMGLGKTIQSISLLAHLATYHEVWGPHLVVVPTSVLLNWEVELKKFAPGFKVLSYYGTQEERKLKRKGWMDNDKWHICITSYQLAVQDALSLKKRDWHYIILDEAHNIKNFRSQRWQTLLNFKSRARLLLTGTPLQNNLTELWSLLFFLAPEEDEQGRSQFGELAEFAKQFHRPVEAILDRGQTELDVESRGIVSKLHTILRPHLLRRMKSEVEKQMPKKYEHITVCRLSKRQRQLYDEFMGRADTKESFASRNYMSIISCLMALRKVCNHPDLFETRSINTSYAMSRSAVADFEIKELLIRKRLVAERDRDTSYRLLNLWRPNIASYNATTTRRIAAIESLADSTSRQRRRLDIDRIYDGSTTAAAIAGADYCRRMDRHMQLAIQYAHTVVRSWQQPSLALNTLDCVTIPMRGRLSNPPVRRREMVESYLSTADALSDIVVPLSERAAQMQPYIQRFACITPKVACEQLIRLALTDRGIETIERARETAMDDNFHEARMRLSIAFPDKTLIQYDCGKLQQLAKLLRQLQAGGHRALIFTQMTKVLDVLERFLNLHQVRYMRLDGTTKIERRQILTDRFNADPTFLCFILSTRSGGLGINLTGADTVIFYDNDWNPAMDKQCQDRCHRIGQTRDVHIYRFVSQGTIEMNILRKSNQKRELDKFIIQEGDFTTDFLSRMGDGDAGADDAIDQVLGGGAKDALVQVEDKDDIDAARVAEKEVVQTDDADFDDRQATSRHTGTPQLDQSSTPAGNEATPSGGQATPALAPSEQPADADTDTPVPPAEQAPDFDIEDDDGSKIRAPGLDRNIRELDGWFLATVRQELSGIVFETAAARRKRELKSRKRKGGPVPLIRR